MVTHEAVSASLRVVESTIALARAETRLALTRARVLAVQAVVLVLGGLVAMTFLALALVIVTLSPLVAGHGIGLRLGASLLLPWPFVVSLSASVAIAALGTWVAVAALRRIRSLASEEDGGSRESTCEK
jgi:hypothetical protein